MQGIIFFMMAFFLLGETTQAQVLKKIKKAGQRGVERTVEKRVEKEASKKTDDALDEVFEKKNKKSKNKQAGSSSNNAEDTLPAPNSTNFTAGDPELDYSGTPVFQDDFDATPTGDFPRKFISSSGGEIVRLQQGNGLKFYPNSNVLLQLQKLPGNFALAFDLTLDKVPPSLYNTYFNIYLQELDKLKHNDPKNKYGAVGFSLWGDKKDHQVDLFNAKARYEIKEKIPYNISGNIIGQTSKWILLKQGHRLRLFINGNKITDSPNLLEGVAVKHINFRLNGTKKEEGHAFIISNVQVTAIAEDIRSQLIDKGQFTTSNILFATASDDIQNASLDILDEIAAAIKTDKATFRIIGHTDSDGDEKDNLLLSQKRAESVKKYLVSKGVASGRLQTGGKGESQPVASNDTPEGKAQNRRVEFLRN